MSPSPLRSKPAALVLPIGRMSALVPTVSLMVAVPPPFARVYCHDGSNVTRTWSPRCQRDCMRMFAVFDGLMRTPQKLVQLEGFASTSLAEVGGAGTTTLLWFSSSRTLAVGT